MAEQEPAPLQGRPADERIVGAVQRPPAPPAGPVRRCNGRLYATLGGIEHGMDDIEASVLMWALARELFPGETLRVRGERKP